MVNQSTSEWAHNQRQGRRRVIDLVCSSTDADTDHTRVNLR